MSESGGALMGFEALRSAGAPAIAVTGQQAPGGWINCPVCGALFAGLRWNQVYCSRKCSDAGYNRAHPVTRRPPDPAQKQRALPGESRVERAFRDWIDTAPGRYVEAEVARLAREDKAAGDRRGEINLYLALVRRSSRGLTLDREGFRCNNSHRSLLARRLMEARPELAGFFEVRPLRGRVA